MTWKGNAIKHQIQKQTGTTHGRARPAESTIFGAVLSDCNGCGHVQPMFATRIRGRHTIQIDHIEILSGLERNGHIAPSSRRTGISSPTDIARLACIERITGTRSIRDDIGESGKDDYGGKNSGQRVGCKHFRKGVFLTDASSQGKKDTWLVTGPAYKGFRNILCC